MLPYYLLLCLIVCFKQVTVALPAALDRPDNLAVSVILPAVTATLLGPSNVNENAELSLKGNMTSILSSSNNTVDILSELKVTKITDNECPSLVNADQLTQTQLIERLTAPCRYDPLERPPVVINGRVTTEPLKVYVRVYIYVLQNLETSDLQFKLHALIQMRYKDPRLQFAEYAPNKKKPIMGETSLRSVIWVPHVFLANEHNSKVLGTDEKDILTSISPDGTVIVSSRVQATLYCWMKLQKFPFDEQFCPTVLESWMYNTSELLLHWERNEPVAFNRNMHLTEYVLQTVRANETIINADLEDLRHGDFAGNYSSLSFTVHLTREVGYYVMDYFLPSIMIVAISWVSFWLQADQTPARTTLGCTTLLSFITLASAQENNLPKVSYIKISEVWFLGCTCFIFGSLVEFAFVNTIWRRKNSVSVKKLKSKYILRSTITPSMKRHKMLDSIDMNCADPSSANKSCERYSSVVESPVFIAMEEEKSGRFNSTASIISQASLDENANEKDKHDVTNHSWATMTPHEVSLWIDRKARFIFPLAFVIFNAFFWTFVYCL